ncbi:MAG: bifunctional oligoribonuclease/PAP phosphatase NrnA [Deltaproteobacteria bacterium]|nr:bifunctional oligoribonuclease/PAP phosphatase NrnA [Deltaproteobacteria bacterium]
MDPLIEQVKKSRRAFLVSHTQPDGDAIGSLTALGLALEALGKKVTLFNVSPIPAVYRFLPATDRIVHDTIAADYDIAFILDCGELKRIGNAVSIVRQIPVIINIDHHITNTRFGTYRLVDTSACATCEVVYRLIKKMAVPFDRAIATSLYTGILTDTGSFRFSNTNRAAFAICEEMIAHGVDPYDIAKRVYGSYSLGRIKLLNLALNSIEISYNGKLSMMTITKNMFQKTNTQPEDVDGLIHYARRIEDVKVAALIQEHYNGKGNNKHHVSLRSDGTVDVAAIAAAFGGGGHVTAAGFNMESTLSEVKSEIIDLAEKL